MHRVPHHVFIACLVACQANVSLLFAQSGSATLVSITTGSRVEENLDNAEKAAYHASDFLSYSLNTSSAKISLARLAAARGGCDEIRSLGMTILKDEAAVNKEIKELAAKRNIFPPIKSESDIADELNIAHGGNAAQFDSKFVELAIAFLEKDVDMLRRATECEDRWVRLLASEHLPLVEHQLAQLRFIRERSKGD